MVKINYKCPRCGYTNSIKTHMKKHYIKRQTLCDPKLKDISKEECLKEVFGDDYETYINKPSKYQSKSISEINPTSNILSINTDNSESVLRQEIEELKKSKKEMEKNEENSKKEIEDLKKQVEILFNNALCAPIVKGDNNTTTIQNINQFIFLNAFGKEKIDYIKSNVICKLTENEPMSCVPKLLREIHFNPEHNENHNIFIPNKKQGFAKIFDGEKWVLTKKKDAIEDMTAKAFDLISNNQSTKTMDKIRASYEDHDKKTTGRIHEDTELMILNNQKSIIKPS